MTALGIVGGIAPESTIDYYRRLIAAYRARSGGDNPHLLINSIDVNHLLALAGAGQLDAMADYLSEAVAALARAGASVALFASNTPHLVFDEVQRRSPIRLISIVEAAGAAAKAMGLCQVGLLGTRFTMQAAFYPAVFVRHGIAVVPPAADEQELVHTRYVGELVEGVFNEATRKQILEVTGHMVRRDHLDGVILAGTELPLLLQTSTTHGVPMLDTTGMHVAAAVAALD